MRKQRRAITKLVKSASIRTGKAIDKEAMVDDYGMAE